MTTVDLPDEFAPEVTEQELESPTFVTVLRVIWFSIRRFFKEKPGQILGSTFILLLLWGTHGRLELLGAIWPAWRGLGVDIHNRPSIIPGLPWDNELLSWIIGVLILVGIPMLLIRFVYKESWSAYGLGLPRKGRRILALQSFVFLTAVSLPAFVVGAQDNSMLARYPFYRPFNSIAEFIIYELAYFLFFLVIEFTFRGYLLFGLAGVRDSEIDTMGGGVPGRFYFDRYALLIQMLSYTAWHLGNPLPEVWGTLIWGLAAGAVAYAVRSIWPVVLSHWLLNVVLDAVLLRRL
jgi:hypothetical protein